MHGWVIDLSTSKNSPHSRYEVCQNVRLWVLLQKIVVTKQGHWPWIRLAFLIGLYLWAWFLLISVLGYDKTWHFPIVIWFNVLFNCMWSLTLLHNMSYLVSRWQLLGHGLLASSRTHQTVQKVSLLLYVPFLLRVSPRIPQGVSLNPR